MFATQILSEDASDESTEECSSEIVGLIIVDDKKYELKKGETKIGRDPSLCSVVIENFTISKVHAVLESDGVDDTFIYDVGSTNQTKLGKKVLKPHCRYKLENGSKLTLGNVTARFVVPSENSSECNLPTSKPGTFDPLGELGDIFDVPTQVTVQPQTSRKVSDFEKLPENFHVFKIPHPVSSEGTSLSSKHCFVESAQCRLNSQQNKERTVYFPNSLESSGIFSLGTQCQLYESPVEPESKCAVEAVSSDKSVKSSESDKIKLLLNDGEDDVLCSFMSLHSPKEQNESEINIKTELKGLTQVLDAPTQAQVEIIEESIEEKERKELSQILQNKDFIEDFHIPAKPSVTSTPLPNKFIRKSNEKSNSRIEDEDFIQTQEFTSLRTTKETNDNVSKDAETQPFLDDTLDQLSSTQQNEDLILTQTFEALEKNNEKNTAIVPETEEMIEEDFLETQIFTVEKEMRTEERKLPESPDGDMNIACTQRNDEDDFIATQAFEETSSARKDEKDSDRNDSGDEDEDFIATQKVEFSVNKTVSRQGTDRASRESSPDLLAPETFSNNSEDCISTQIFEPLACQKLITTTEQISSLFKKENDSNIPPAPEPAESSGDETESDLEILLDSTKKDGEICHEFIKSEQPESGPHVAENDDSNSSYIFELPPEKNSEKVVHAAHLSDSDAIDREEMINDKVKEEPKEKMEYEDTQVLTLTLPDNFEEKTSAPNDEWMTGGPESPRFGGESPLSLEMPNTQEIETTMNRILRRECEREDSKKTEVGITNGDVSHRKVELPENLIDSPLKRPRVSNSGEVVPVKKYKTEASNRTLKDSEKQFSKLVQAHDIAQIQQSRTRNSMKNVRTENKKGVSILESNINERPTSRRKANTKRGSTKNPNGDITQYLTRNVERLSLGSRKREASPNENQPRSTRVLRSSTKNATTPNLANVPLRRSKRNSGANEYFTSSCVKVLFTGFDCEFLEKVISDLGGKKTNDLSSGEVVVTDKVRRTVKFLSAIGLGLPIVSPQWLLSCKKERKFLNPWDFILKDEVSEEKWDFDLKASLEKSKKAKLLQGFNVFATKSTKPPVKDLLAIVEFCGGTPLFDYPDVWPKKTIIVSCLEDQKWWPLARFRQVKIVHYEFILTGVLRQKIDFKTYRLR